MNMRTRNNKNNLSPSKTNNESSNLTNYTNKNDINIYLNKNINIFTKKKTRNRYDNAFLNKNTFNLSRNKIPSCLKGRPNNLITKKKNYSMIGYDYVINNLNQNLTERENSNKNKSRDENYKKTRHCKVLTGLQINFPNLEHLSKNKINSERNQNIKNSHNRNISENEILSIVLKNNLLNKSKSKSKNKSKIFRIQNIKKRNKFTNSLQTLLIEDTSKWKEITKKSINILDDKKNKKISKEIYSSR